MNILRAVKQYMLSFRHDIHWDIRIYDRNEFENNKQNTSKVYHFDLIGDKKYWYADPILMDYEKKTYLFFEQYDIKARRGMVGYSEITQNGLTKPVCIINNSFHMSFPMVFEYNGQCYMIPETEEDNSLQLYRAERFPDKWTFEKKLLTGIKATDTILLKSGKDAFLLVSEDRNHDSCNMVNVLFQFDLDKMCVIGTGVDVASGTKGIRNAGKAFTYDGKCIRPGQDCTDNVYGKGILFWEYSLDNNFSEKLGSHAIQPLMLFGEDTNYTGTHTFSISNHYIAVDCRRDTDNGVIYTLLLTLRFMLQRIKRKIR